MRSASLFKWPESARQSGSSWFDSNRKRSLIFTRTEKRLQLTIYKVFLFKPHKGLSLASLTPEPPTCRVHDTYVSCEKRDAASPIQCVAAGFRLLAFYETNSSHFAQSCQRARRRLASSLRDARKLKSPISQWMCAELFIYTATVRTQLSDSVHM